MRKTKLSRTVCEDVTEQQPPRIARKRVDYASIVPSPRTTSVASTTHARCSATAGAKQRNKPFWVALRTSHGASGAAIMKRVLITGGAGFIGSHLVDTLLRSE